MGAETSVQSVEPKTEVVRRAGVLRVRLARDEPVRWLTQSEFVRQVSDAADRAGLPLARSAVPQAKPIITPGPPLSLGHTSRCEYMDFGLDAPIPALEFGRRLGAALPEGIRVLWQWRLPPRALHPRAAVVGFCYTILVEVEPKKAEAFAKADVWPLRQMRKKGERVLDLKQSVSRLAVERGSTVIHLRVRPEGTPKPEEVLESVFGIPQAAAAEFAIERTSALFIREHGSWRAEGE